VISVALNRLAELNPPTPEFNIAGLHEDVQFYPLEAVWHDARADHTRRAPKEAVATGYSRFHRDDVLVPKVTPTFQAGRAMLAQRMGAGTTELHVLRARPGVDPRWICYAVRSGHFLQEGVTAFEGVAGLQRIPPEYVMNFRIVDIAGDQQRRIADFLDDRVLRIDQIITARRQQSDRVHELEQAELTHVLWSPGDEVSALRRHGVSVTTGPFGTVFSAADYVDDGIPMVNPTHIKRGAIISDPSHSVSRDTQRRLARHILRTNDLVMSRKGDIGHTAKVRQDQAGWICGSDSIAIHAEGSSIKPEFLDLFLKLTRARGQLIAHSNAATMPSLNEGNLLSLRVPFVNPREQEDRIAAGARIQRAASAGVENLQRSAELLSDYKQALITAAVTGELDVTTAGSGIPG
jgi:type I restriction enzyme S subunit